MSASQPVSSRFARLTREGLWIVLGQIAAVLGLLFGVRLLTGLMGPAAYGELALAMTLGLLVSQTVLGPLGSGALRFYAPAVEEGELPAFLRAVGRLALWTSAAVLLAALPAGGALILLGYGSWLGAAVAALVFAMLSGHNALMNGLQTAARRRAVVALHQALEPWARVLAAAALILLLGASSAVALCGFIAGAGLVLASQLAFFRRSLPATATISESDGKWERRIWDYSWPFASWGVLVWSQQASERWALELFATTADVGLYSVLFQIGYTPMATLTGLAVVFLAPILFQRAGDASDARRNADVARLSRRVTACALGMTAVAVLAAQLLHTPVFRWLVAPEYARVSHLLPGVVLAGGLFAAAQALALNLMSQMKTRRLMAAKVGTALLGVGLNFAGAALYGVGGVVVAGIVFAATYLGWMALLSRTAPQTPAQNQATEVW